MHNWCHSWQGIRMKAFFPPLPKTPTTETLMLGLASTTGKWTSNWWEELLSNTLSNTVSNWWGVTCVTYVVRSVLANLGWVCRPSWWVQVICWLRPGLGVCRYYIIIIYYFYYVFVNFSFSHASALPDNLNFRWLSTRLVDLPRLLALSTTTSTKSATTRPLTPQLGEREEKASV